MRKNDNQRNKKESKGNIVIEKSKEEGFTQVPNNIFKQNEKLSAKAIGVYCTLLFLPCSWNLNQTEFTRHFKDGRESLMSAFKELKNAGFLEIKKIKDTRQRIQWIYIIHPDGNPE